MVAYFSEKKDMVRIAKPSKMERLYPIRGETSPDTNRLIVYPIDKKEKILPATPWLIASSSSIIGRKGEITAREEKTR